MNGGGKAALTPDRDRGRKQPFQRWGGGARLVCGTYPGAGVFVGVVVGVFVGLGVVGGASAVAVAA
jgi:hypothetical protein